MMCKKSRSNQNAHKKMLWYCYFFYLNHYEGIKVLKTTHSDQMNRFSLEELYRYHQYSDVHVWGIVILITHICKQYFSLMFNWQNKVSEYKLQSIGDRSILIICVFFIFFFRFLRIFVCLAVEFCLQPFLWLNLSIAILTICSLLFTTYIVVLFSVSGFWFVTVLNWKKFQVSFSDHLLLYVIYN